MTELAGAAIDGPVIDDPDDPRMAVFMGLSDQELRQRREAPGGDMAGVFIAEGDLVIQRAIDAGHSLRSVFVEAARSRPLEFELGDAPLLRAGEPVVQVIASHRRYRGSMACFDRPSPVPVGQVTSGARTVVVTEGVNNPTNIGVIIRTAAGLGVDALLVDPTSCDPLARRTVRVSMGATFALPHARLGALPDAMNELTGFTTLAMTPDPSATSLESLDLAPDEPVALLLGAEAPGLTDATLAAADHRVRIAMYHGVDSLNVATAAAISMWAVQSRQSRSRCSDDQARV